MQYKNGKGPTRYQFLRGLVRFRTARTFDTEGDMYEHITGRRSEVIDEADNRKKKMN